MTAADRIPDANATREGWFHRGVDAFRPRFVEVGYPLPDIIHVSIGFSYGARRENEVILGTTWKRERSADGNNHLFISPEDSDTARILETLLHELIHVTLDCEDGHKKRFAEIATRLGFEGPMAETPASIELAAELMTLADALGEFPHARLDPLPIRVPVDANVPNGATITINGTSGPKPQKNRRHKCLCQKCGYNVLISTKWLAEAAPPCGICGEPMDDTCC